MGINRLDIENRRLEGENEQLRQENTSLTQGNARLTQENADMRRRRNEVLIANYNAQRSLLGALPTAANVITGIEQLAQRAAERIRELERQWREIGAQLAEAQQAARNIQENSAE